MSKMVFLDTNVYLHYQLFDQINWPKVLKASEVMIVVPPVTIRELNRHKELHPRSQVKERAGTVIRKLQTLFVSGSQAHVRDGVEIRLEDRDPTIDFEAFQLNHDIQDDHLIASIIMLRNEEPGADVILITSDAGLALMAKARRLSIQTTMLPDNLKLTEEPDPNQLHIRELEEKIRALELKIPQLSLTFEDGNNHFTYVLQPPIELTREELAVKLQAIEQQYPKLNHPKLNHQPKEQIGDMPEQLASVAEAVASVNAYYYAIFLPSAEIDRYNTELDKFYQTYAEYVRSDVSFQNLKHRSIKLSLLVANDGTAPAEDVDVFLHFPDVFELKDERGFPKHPIPPDPPAKPRTQMAQLLGLGNGARMILPHLITRKDSILRPPNVSAPNIKRTSGFDVNFHVQRIKHRLQESAEPLYIVFESFERAKSFQISYRMLAANLPSEVTGKLGVVIRKD